MHPTRRAAIASLLALAVAGVSVGTAPTARADEPEIYAPAGVAVSGYDAVAYFTQGRAVPGDRAHALRWQGVVWYFASSDAMEAFEMNPHAYAPQFGGYCALSASVGTLAPSNPEVFMLYQGRLFLNGSVAQRDDWTRNIADNLALADANWPSLVAR